MTQTPDPTEIPLGEKLVAGLIALAGLVLVWALQFVLPDWLREGTNGVITGAFGVLAVTRLWPGLPLRNLPWWLGSIVAYGIVVAIVARI
jgi:hypothetical protein